MIELVRALAPDPAALVVAVAIDLVLGDPVYRAHPVRLIGRTLQWFERRLRAAGLDGYGGGILLFVLLAGLWLPASAGIVALALEPSRRPRPGWCTSCSSTRCSRSVICCTTCGASSQPSVDDDIERARQAVSALVGRDTDRMDGAACRRAAVESLSENLTDGFVSPVFWYVFAGCRDSCSSRSSARWTRWWATRHRSTYGSAGAAHVSTM